MMNGIIYTVLSINNTKFTILTMKLSKLLNGNRLFITYISLITIRNVAYRINKSTLCLNFTAETSH
jgi:hypothetical protein